MAEKKLSEELRHCMNGDGEYCESCVLDRLEVVE